MSKINAKLSTPILGNFSDLGKMLIDGQARVNKIKAEVNQERLLLNKNLTESIKDISATGITEYDKVIHNGAQQFRAELAQAVRDNRAGLISRSEVSAMASSFQTQAGILANSTELYQKNADRIQKGIESGSLSQIDMDDYNAAWFQDPNFAPLDLEDGVKRAPLKAITTALINGELYYSAVKQVRVPDPKNPGKYKTETVPIQRKVSEMLNPNIKATQLFDIDKDVVAFKGIIGKQDRYITIDGKTMMGSPYTTSTKQLNGDVVTSTTVAPGYFPTFVKQVENRVSKIDSKLAAQILYERFGARSLLHDDSKGIQLQEEWEDDFGAIKTEYGGVEEEIPRYYDINGKQLKFTTDPRVLSHTSEGQSFASEEQIELAKAVMRGEYHNSFNISTKDYVNRKKIASSGKPDPTLNQIVKTEYQVNGVMRPVDNKYFKQTIGLASLLVANRIDDYQVAKGEMTAGGSYTPPVIRQNDGDTPFSYTPASVQKLFNEDNNRTLVGASFTGQAIKLLDKEIKVSTVHGTPLDTISGIAISTDNDGTANTFVVLTGDSVYRQSETGIKIQQGGASDSSVDTQTNIEQTETGVAVLTNNQLPSVYEELYKIPEFREVMKKRGFIGISAKYTENVGTEAAPVYKEKAGQFIDAFESYANYLIGL